MKWILGLACLLLAATASAQSIYKCRDANGGFAYQSDPCANPEKRWDVQPGARYGTYSADDRMTAAQSERRINRDRQAVQAGNSPRYSGAVVGSARGAVIGPSSASQCAAARSHRDAVRKAAGLRLSYALASATDRAVFDNCK
ncbi:DUF4124 domain-containing protein [Pseudoxanthomonas winnipegensis]|uniref:DUF4124 domain-containing protein n=1 Tax=Pseudoxanthomonas winnipegensis TaxID=2480810 RepID=A0ABY1WF83_9GAMM|nr:DUF4124 domain-containing protein [Pseudoxanthomonas winnipegensis]